ncbi:hypothetical protein FDUTEX481_07209 [Tolypothrix sp. PCC 7601]|nr:hypothetical protein FDUTEX481_07209 [Tolypothrix sp. PCC 7601]
MIRLLYKLASKNQPRFSQMVNTLRSLPHSCGLQLDVKIQASV